MRLFEQALFSFDDVPPAPIGGNLSKNLFLPAPRLGQMWGIDRMTVTFYGRAQFNGGPGTDECLQLSVQPFLNEQPVSEPVLIPANILNVVFPSYSEFPNVVAAPPHPVPPVVITPYIPIDCYPSDQIRVAANMTFQGSTGPSNECPPTGGVTTSFISDLFWYVRISMVGTNSPISMTRSPENV